MKPCLVVQHVSANVVRRMSSTYVSPLSHRVQPSMGGVEERRTIGTHKGPICCVHVMKAIDGKIGAGLVLTGSTDATIRVWDPSEAQFGKRPCLLQTLVGHGGSVTTLCRTMSYILSGSRDGSFRVWRAAPGRDQALYPWFEPVVGLFERILLHL